MATTLLPRASLSAPALLIVFCLHAERIEPVSHMDLKKSFGFFLLFVQGNKVKIPTTRRQFITQMHRFTTPCRGSLGCSRHEHPHPANHDKHLGVGGCGCVDGWIDRRGEDKIKLQRPNVLTETETKRGSPCRPNTHIHLICSTHRKPVAPSHRTIIVTRDTVIRNIMPAGMSSYSRYCAEPRWQLHAGMRV